MTYYATCFNCAIDKASCHRRLSLQKALAGCAVTSVKFRCPDRKAFFSPGQRVSFSWNMWDSDGDDECALPLTFHGTVIRERGSKFVIQVDSGPDASGEGIKASDVFKSKETLLIKVRPADMTTLDEPTQTVCLTCYQIEGHPDKRCYRSGTSWKPDGCIEPDEAPSKPLEEECWF